MGVRAHAQEQVYRKVVFIWRKLKAVVHTMTDTHYACFVLIETRRFPHVYVCGVDTASYAENCHWRTFTALINRGMHGERY